MLTSSIDVAFIQYKSVLPLSHSVHLEGSLIRDETCAVQAYWPHTFAELADTQAVVGSRKKRGRGPIASMAPVSPPNDTFQLS